MALVRASQAETSSNSSSRRCGYRYDVFLSFRGEDTRKTFTDHLYTALNNSGFLTFRDDDELERCEDIKPGLQKAIQQSRTFVIVFSKDYASSRWCLDELVIILEQKRMTSGDHVVLPVFYNVDPSHVRKQTGSLAKAFARHQKTQPLKKLKKWREVLAEVADLGGMVLKNQDDGYESKFIRKIVDVIKDKLRRTPLSVAPNMIGMHSRVEKINRWLRDGATDVGVLFIYGMGGIGKTTIAKSVYNSNFERFEGSSFLENIRDISQQPNGLVQIQRQLLSDILNGGKVKIHSVSEGVTKIEDVIGCKKVLLVLDDVDHIYQLDAVLRMKDRFHSGSKIIITSRLKKLSKAHQVTMIHQVKMLDYNESLELFSWHAFGQDKPTKGYMGYSEKIVQQAGGLPLALQVLGSSLSGESICVWKSGLEKLEAIPHDEIMKKLRISYDSLQDDHDRNLFLHIACFLIGKEKDYIVRILDGCHFFTIVGIQNLIDRCLVTLDKFDKVNIHDMLRDMGRGIVRQESEDPEKRSRLWHNKDSSRVLREKNGTQTIEGLVLQMQPNSPTNERVIETNAFARMHKLILLHLSHVQLEGCCAEFLVGLRWLCWLKFPLDSVPTDFHLENLIVLEMQHSSLRRVFEGSKCLSSLHILDLSHSHALDDTANFSFCPNLEKLILVDCTSLVDAHESIGNLERLVYLNMKDCRNLRTLPQNMVMLESLETLILSDCSSLDELSIMMMRSMESIKVLKIDGIPIRELWPGGSAFDLSAFPCSIVDLSLSGCNLSDDAFPIDLGNLSSLRRLYLDSNPISRLPDFIKGLKRLESLSFRECTKLISLIDLPQVDCVKIVSCRSLEKVTYGWDSLCSVYLGENPNLEEWEPLFMLEPIERVDVEIINLLGLCNLESLAPIRMVTPYPYLRGAQYKGSPVKVYAYFRGPYKWSRSKGLYEKRVFSTFFAGSEVPGQFSHTSRGSPISFIVPVLFNHRIRGLNLFSVYANSENVCIDANFKEQFLGPVITKVSNKSKGLKWIYGPRFHGIPGKGEDVIWLSHWKMENCFEEGNEVVVSVILRPPGFRVKEFGVQLVHEEEEHNVMTTTQPSTMDPCCFPYMSTRVHKVDPIWFDKFFEDYDFSSIQKEDSDDDTDLSEKVEEQNDDCTIAAIKGSKSNNWGHKGWKVLITAAGFFLMLSLIARSSLSQKKNQQSSSSPPSGFLYMTQSSCGKVTRRNN